MQTSWDALCNRTRELRDLDGVLGLLSWDEETYAPPGAREARGRQQATLEAIRHRRLVDPELGDLLEAAGASSASDPLRLTMIARLRRQRERALRVPESLVKAFAVARSSSLDAWLSARSEDRFEAFEPWLHRMVELSRERADALATEGGARYDALLDEHEPDMVAATIERVFADLRDFLVDLVRRIASTGRSIERGFLAHRYDRERQWAVTLDLLRELGFDLERGRQDESAHPFTGSCAEDDIRLTTRIREDDVLSGLFSTIHECGHGLYEQGFDRGHHGSYVAAAPSMGIHESQSRLYENMLGRSLEFWRHYLPRLQAIFPAQLGGVTAEGFHFAVNVVVPSHIRVEADEVTYNLHIMIRFELERALIAGDLSARDLPGAWREKTNEYLGVVPDRDADGCLQDIHWAWGAFGYFPTYTIGNLYAAQLMARYLEEVPSAPSDFEAGRFLGLREWLREHIHRHGYERSAEDTIRAVTGHGLETAAFETYLRRKYSALYGL